MVVAVVIYLAVGRTPDGIDPEAAKELARGGRVYAQNCAACHLGEIKESRDSSLKSRILPMPAKQAADEPHYHPKNFLASILKPGKRLAIAGFEDKLTVEQVRAVIAFLANRWPDRVPLVPASPGD